MWDLEENEEITNLIGWSHLTHPETIVRSGHQLSVINYYNDEEDEIQSNESCSIFATNKWCTKLYAELDLQEMKNI